MNMLLLGQHNKMSKDQVIKKGKAILSHHTDGGSFDVIFEFSANEQGQIKIIAKYDNKRKKTHIEIEHEPITCFVDHLIEWLQEQQDKAKKD